MVCGNFDGTAGDDLALDFGPGGLQVWENNALRRTARPSDSRWIEARLAGEAAQALLAHDQALAAWLEEGPPLTSLERAAARLRPREWMSARR